MSDGFGDRIPNSIIFRYGIGQLGAQVFRDTPAVLLPLFLITVLAVPAWQAGLVVLIPKLWLILCDPFVGIWSDRSKERFGRTPFLIVGALGTAFGFVVLFSITSYPSPSVAAMSVCALFFMASTAFSVFSVPYLAVASELSGNPHERSRIMVMRMVFAASGVLLGVGASQPLIEYFGGGAAGWSGMSYVLGAVCLVTMLITAGGLHGAPRIAANPVQGGLSEQFRLVRGNRPFLILLTTSFLSNVGQASSYTVLAFIFLYAVDAVWLIPLFILTMSICGIISQPFWLWLSRRTGKPKAYRIAALSWVAVTVTWFWVDQGGAAVIEFPGGLAFNLQHILVLSRAAVIGVVNAAFIMLALSMLTDTVDYQRRLLGKANEGTFAGLFSAFEKLAFAIGPVIAGFVMSAFGFVPSQGEAIVQSDHAVFGIVLLYSLIPATLQVLALFVFARYRLPELQALS